MAPMVFLLISVIYIHLHSTEARTWLFAVSGNRRPFSYIDKTGRLVGFDMDLINNVCSIADEKCQVTMQPFSECVQTTAGRFTPGRGIMSGWFDACMGYTISQDRVNSMGFSDPYLKTSARMAVRPGNPRGVNYKSLRNNIITHLSGAYTNRECLHRLNISVHDVIIAANLSVAKELVLNGTVDAILSPRSRVPDLQTLDMTLNCDLGGVGVMVPKRSKVPEWWNEAFEEYRESGDFHVLCEQWKAKSNTPIKCLDSGMSGSASLIMRTELLVLLVMAAMFLGTR